jgi:hypothetical protein
MHAWARSQQLYLRNKVLMHHTAAGSSTFLHKTFVTFFSLSLARRLVMPGTTYLT